MCTLAARPLGLLRFPKKTLGPTAASLNFINFIDGPTAAIVALSASSQRIISSIKYTRGFEPSSTVLENKFRGCNIFRARGSNLDLKIVHVYLICFRIYHYVPHARLRMFPWCIEVCIVVSVLVACEGCGGIVETRRK